MAVSESESQTEEPLGWEKPYPLGFAGDSDGPRGPGAAAIQTSLCSAQGHLSLSIGTK